MARLPQPGGDSGNWGDILNDFLSQSHTSTGAIKPGAVSKSDVGLGNVDNTSDASKPVSTAQQTALDAKLNSADLDSQVALKIQDTTSSTAGALTDTYARGAQYVSRTASDALIGLKRSLDAGVRSCALQVMSDSTANDTTDWPYLLAQKVAADYPNWTVRWQTWVVTNQRFGTPTIIQTGTAGDLYLDGSTGANALRLDSSVSPYISSALDVQVKLRLVDWDVQQNLVAKSGAAGQRGWIFQMTTTGTGRPSFTYSTDGTTQVTAACNTTPPQAAGTDVWLRVTYQGNDGAGNTVVKFYTATDGMTWTQLGSTVTTVGATTLFNNSSTGISLGGNTATLAGSRFYEIRVRDGIDGPNKVPALPDLWPPISTPDANARAVGAPVFTVINGGKAGGDIAYLIDSTRLPKLMPNFGQAVIFLSQSHNMGTQLGDQWYNTYKNFADTVQPIRPGVPMIVLNENPEKGTATNKEWHAQRARELPAIARRLSYGFIDTFQMFTDEPTYQSSMMADDVHPNATGSDLWATLIYNAIKSAA
jgi:hypothetical protein